MIRRLSWLVTLGLMACGGSTEPASRVPRVGRYAYSSDRAGTGTLTITTATAERVSGTWDVKGATGGTMTGAVDLGSWNIDAYVLYGTQRYVIAGIPFSTQYAHRITRDGDRMACSVQPIGSPPRQPCTLTYLGP